MKRYLVSVPILTYVDVQVECADDDDHEVVEVEAGTKAQESSMGLKFVEWNKKFYIRELP